jgi:hypothetical protein
MMIINRAKPDLNESICQSFFHDSRKWRCMRSPIALVGIVDIRVRINMKDGQLAVTATYRTHNRMRDGMITTETDQSIPRLDCTGDPLLDDIPSISDTVELNIAMVKESARDTYVDTGFAPAAIAVGE